MEQIYSVYSPSSSSNQRLSKWLLDQRCVSSLSKRNLLAFTSFSDLSQSETKYLFVHVYIVDLNLPHEPILVTTRDENITTIDWDQTGASFLLADDSGTIEIWGIKDHLINEWVMIHQFSAFSGEIILSACWFNNGHRTLVVPEKIDHLGPYEEKFVSSTFTPSVVQFGGKSANGCIAVSNSGLVWCVVILSDNSYVTCSNMLGTFRTRLKLVDISYCKKGEFLVVTSNGAIDSPVNSYKISIKLSIFPMTEKNQCKIECEPFSSIFLDCLSDSNFVTGGYKCVNQLKFVIKEESETGQFAVAVGVSGTNRSCLELWESTEKPVHLHRVFQSKNGTDFSQNTTFKRTFWHHLASSTNDQPITSITSQKSTIFKLNPLPTYIIVSYQDNSVKCLSRDNLHPVYHFSIGSSLQKLNMANKFGVHYKASNGIPTTLVDLQLSWSSCILVAMDASSQLYVYKIPPLADLKNGFSASFLQTMFEYSLYTCLDWWDILVCVKPNLVDSICESMKETFNQRQTQAIQQKYMNYFLAINASLYRLNSGASATTGQNKSGDCYATIMLNAISNTIRSQLRPAANQDKEGPAEFLSNFIQTKGTEPLYFNVDKVLLAVDHKDFLVEPNIVQSFQHLNQWVGDFSLFLLASLPQQFHNHFRFPGGGLISDPKSLNILRELLVIIRIWGLLKENCLPVFTKLQNKTKDVDVVALIFKLLSKTVTTLGSEPDESFLDECCSLSNQFLIPQLDLTLKARGVASPTMFTNILPLTFQYFADAPFLKYHVKTHIVDGTVNSKAGRKMDLIRHICLGPKNSSNESIRVCTRCPALSYYSSFKSASTKAWDSRWYYRCICGGNWKLDH